MTPSSSFLNLPSTPATFDPESRLESIELSIREMLDGSRSAPELAERRREGRRPYPEPFLITPLDAAGQPRLADTVAVIGRNVSDHGVDFYATSALPFRHAIASFQIEPDRWISFAMKLTWCRFNRFGWYDNGGHFLRTVPTPFETMP